MSVDEVQRLFQHLQGTNQLLAKLLYGTGMRLTEGLRLRVKDIDFERSQIIVRQAKGQKDRSTVLPQSIQHLLQAHLLQTQQIHHDDLAKGYSAVVTVPFVGRYRKERANGLDETQLRAIASLDSPSFIQAFLPFL